MQQKKWIVRSAKVLNGTPVFAGTRVPVQTLLEYLEAGQSILEFLDDFPTVDRKHAICELDYLKQLMLSQTKFDFGKGANLPRTRLATRPVKPPKHVEGIPQRTLKTRRLAFSEESKYQSVLTRLHNLGWQPGQLPGRRRTVYTLNSRGTVLAIFRHAKKQKNGREFLCFFGLSKTMFEEHISRGRCTFSCNAEIRR